MTRRALACSLMVLASIGAIIAYQVMEQRRQTNSLTARLKQIVPAGMHIELPCPEIAASHPFVLLALGQSNAGNHGSPPNTAVDPLTLISEGKCIKATAPLPGGTGTGGSIWQWVPPLLSPQKNARPMVLSVLAVDATSISDWTNQSSPLRDRLAAHVASMHRLGLGPDLVLWQQGEADALIGTNSAEYSNKLGQLAAILKDSGNKAPIILARSTICRSAPSATIRSAIETTVSNDNRFRLGPDTDVLANDTFRNGCHLTAEGLHSAAKMWAATINSEILTGKFAH